MSVFEEFIKINKLKKKDIAEYLNVSAAFITQLVQGSRSVPEDSIALIKANDKWDTSMFCDKYLLSSKSEIPNENKKINIQSAVSNDVTMSREIFDLLKNQSETILSQQRTIEKLADREKTSTAGAV